MKTISIVLILVNNNCTYVNCCTSHILFCMYTVFRPLVIMYMYGT